jgi:hypothetical protein
MENHATEVIMKRYLIGFIVGAIVASSTTAFADDIKSLIGKQVEGEVPVIVDGKEIAKSAVIIDGSSYAPVRAIGEALGRNVGFKDSKVIVEKTEVKVIPTETVERSLRFYDLQTKQKELTNQIVELYTIIKPYESVSIDAQGKPVVKPKDDIYYETKKKRDDLISQRDEIEKQIKVISDEIEAENKKKMEDIRSRLSSPSPTPAP